MKIKRIPASNNEFATNPCNELALVVQGALVYPSFQCLNLILAQPWPLVGYRNRGISSAFNQHDQITTEGVAR